MLIKIPMPCASENISDSTKIIIAVNTVEYRERGKPIPLALFEFINEDVPPLIISAIIENSPIPDSGSSVE